MPELLSAAQMRRIESAAIDANHATGLELMERAGRGVVDAVFRKWPGLARTPNRAEVLCGPGNNGGDGFVVARLLHQWGWAVDVHLFGDPVKLPPDARANCDRWQGIGEIKPYADDDPSAFLPRDDARDGAHLLVDAVFGTGLTRPAEGIGAFAEATRRAPKLPAVKSIAVDIPSGLCADSGLYLHREGRATDPAGVRADLTVSFHAEKLGHRLSEGPEACGEVAICDIGLSRMPSGDDSIVRMTAAPKPRTLAKRAAHKYGHGHAVILSGGAGRTGAARLAARAALRIGAGLVTLAVPPAAQQEVACQITALMLRRVETADDLASLLGDPRLNAVCLGPGLGVGARTRDLVAAALSRGDDRTVVLDADALTSFEAAPRDLFELLHDRCVLTPHDGEFTRLFPDIGERLAQAPAAGPGFSRVDAAGMAAVRAGCVVLLKGPDTVIAAPDGRCSVNSAGYDRAAPGLATAGSGDVLAGFITGLLARGFAPMEAAETAGWLHVECARSFGAGLIAEDLSESLPAVFNALGV